LLALLTAEQTHLIILKIIYLDLFQQHDPQCLAISPDGTCALVAVADANNNLIRQIIFTPASVKTLADTQGAGETVNGIGTKSRFNSPNRD
jgi:hypothetical protein